jgi:hypothetical protein
VLFGPGRGHHPHRANESFELASLDALRTVAMVMAGGAQHLVVLRDLLDERPLTKVFENGS